MNHTSPILIEDGTKYFLRETLKQCHKKRLLYFNKIMNIILFFIFCSILGTFLYYKYKTKLTPKEKEEKMKQDKIFVLNKLKSMRLHHRKKTMITNLPKFESTFEMLHNQYYKI